MKSLLVLHTVRSESTSGHSYSYTTHMEEMTCYSLWMILQPGWVWV